MVSLDHSWGFLCLDSSKELVSRRNMSWYKWHHFNFYKMLSVCVCVHTHVPDVCMCVFRVLFRHLNLSFPPKFAVILSPEGAFWLTVSVTETVKEKGLSWLLPFSQGNLLKQSFQQQIPLTLIISGLDENTIFCRLWLKEENY